MIFKYKQPEEKFDRYDLSHQGLTNTRVAFCWLPTTLVNKDVVWFEYVKIEETCKLCQGFTGFHVIWETKSITLANL